LIIVVVGEAGRSCDAPGTLHPAADWFVGPNINEAIITLRSLQHLVFVRLGRGELVPDELRQRGWL
jgi:hypothetical protein